MSDSLGNSIRGGAASRLTNDVGHTIQGSGFIGADQIAITNAGLNRGQPADRAGDQSERERDDQQPAP